MSLHLAVQTPELYVYISIKPIVMFVRERPSSEVTVMNYSLVIKPSHLNTAALI